ncbi:MAG: 3-methyl-2-oxobutanoate hydroxymethyltransferase [Chitinophagaceae bacterium]|nr:3-methyl-2-oxobutanoate hydroxymethyltransferase [Chitinophagaceae bacterium]
MKEPGENKGRKITPVNQVILEAIKLSSSHQLYNPVGNDHEFHPRFLRKYLNLYDEITNAVRQYISDVKSKDFPNAQEQY